MGRGTTEPVSLRVLGVASGDVLSLEPAEPSMIVPIESARTTIEVGGSAYPVDRSGFVVTPPSLSVRIHPAQSIASVAVLGLSEPALDAMVATHAELGVRRDRLEAWLSGVSLMPRTVWVHEIVHRYVFERSALEAHDSQAARFLEVEIVKELYFLFRDRDDGVERASIQRSHGRPVTAVLEHIMANLASWSSAKELASIAGVSERSLLRAFRQELGTSPAAYWRERKLDAALDLLRAGAHGVAEVAHKVGYDNPSAFGDAFRRRFGRSPSRFKPDRPVRPAP